MLEPPKPPEPLGYWHPDKADRPAPGSLSFTFVVGFWLGIVGGLSPAVMDVWLMHAAKSPEMGRLLTLALGICCLALAVFVGALASKHTSRPRESSVWETRRPQRMLALGTCTGGAVALLLTGLVCLLAAVG
jgi:hypothetical protein